MTGKREVMPDDGLSSGCCPEVGFGEIVIDLLQARFRFADKPSRMGAHPLHLLHRL